jgi:hypothetical protein
VLVTCESEQTPANLLPAFIAGYPAIGMMGSRIQLQQRNCFRFSRNSFQTIR